MTSEEQLNYRIKATSMILYTGSFLYLIYSLIFNSFISFEGGYFYYFFINTIYCILVGININKIKKMKIDIHLMLDIALMISFTLASLIPFFVAMKFNWRDDLRFMLFFILLSNLESSFFSYKKTAFIQYCISTSMAFYIIFTYDISLSFKLAICLTLLLLFVWKFVISVYYSGVLINRENEVKEFAYKRTIEKIRHEVNNTNTIIYGLLNSFKKKEVTNSDLLKLEKGIVRLSNNLKELEDASTFVSKHIALEPPFKVVKLKKRILNKKKV